jgi:hypothetical protein
VWSFLRFNVYLANLVRGRRDRFTLVVLGLLKPSWRRSQKKKSKQGFNVCPVAESYFIAIAIAAVIQL